MKYGKIKLILFVINIPILGCPLSESLKNAKKQLVCVPCKSLNVNVNLSVRPHTLLVSFDAIINPSYLVQRLAVPLCEETIVDIRFCKRLLLLKQIALILSLQLFLVILFIV